MMSHGTVIVITNILTHLNSSLLMSANPPLTGDDIVRTQLQSLRGTEFHRLIYATIAVILGVIFEEFDVIAKILHIDTERLVVSRIGAIIVPRFELSIWVRRIARFAWIVLVAGLVAEIFFETDISGLDTDLEHVTESQIQAARGAAAKANERAAQLEVDAEGLHKEAEHERLERVQLEASIGWRHLTESEQGDVGLDLMIRFPKAIAAVWYLNGDIEGSRFAADIAEALRKARFGVWPPRDTGLMLRGGGNLTDPITRDPTGVTVQPANDALSNFLADAIVKDLTSLGFDAIKNKPFQPQTVPGIPQVVITVERRPEGPQGEFKLEAEHEVQKRTAQKK
jgi:hypothetical protein